MTKQIVKIIVFILLMCPHLAQAEIRISVIAPKSGEYKVWGDELIAGVKTAVDEINNQGGIKGQRLTLMSIDDPCSDNLALSTAQMLALNKEKPDLVIGPYCSNNFDKVSAIYSKAKIFQIVPTTLNYRYASQNHKGVIKIPAYKEQASRDFFAFYNKHYAGKKVALIFDGEDETILESAHAVADEFRRHGKTILLKNYAFNDFDGDLNLIAENVVANGEDIAVIWGKSKKIAKMIRNIKRLNSKAVIFTGKYMAGDDFDEYAGDYLDSVYFMSVPPVEDNPDFAETIVNLRLKGVELSGLSVYGYAAVQMWADLVKKSGGYSYERITDNIQKKQPESPWSKAFSNNVTDKKTLRYIFYSLQNGEYVPVE